MRTRMCLGVHKRGRPGGRGRAVRTPIVHGLIASQEHALLGAVGGRDVHREKLEDVPPLRHRSLACSASRPLVALLGRGTVAHQCL
jgi:hypothetical protein